MKFGKQIQKKQLEIPEYAAHFVDYKALKKLIKELKQSPVPQANVHPSLQPAQNAQNQSQLALQANKEKFFFKVDRELDKVNDFYTIKESESKVRLRVLTDKQKSMRIRFPVISKSSTHYITLEQGFRDFIKDLTKLQQFTEINATAFSKILKKWDKTSKSQTKELYLSRAVEIQPCFNRDVISELSDQAATSLLDCAAWAEGEGVFYSAEDSIFPTPRLEQEETDASLLDSLYRGDILTLTELLTRLGSTESSSERITRAFLTAVSQAPEDGLKLLLQTNQVDLNRRDEINERNALHKAAMYGRIYFVQASLHAGIDPSGLDAYGRIPLHYACMNGHVSLISDLVDAMPQTVDMQDLENFTPLIHSIVNGRLACVEKLLSYSPRIEPVNDTDHLPLNLACQHGSVPIVELLLQRNPVFAPDAEGLYPQHLAARFGRDPALFLLLQSYNADLNQTDKLYQWTPLFHAASEGHAACLRALLQNGAKVNVKDEKGLPALYYAAWEGNVECMAILAGAGPESSRNSRKDLKVNAKAHQKNSVSKKLPDSEVIPDLALPPPIMPTRRYGHNYLENKSTVLITLGEDGGNTVTFDDPTKYPGSRLTIAPRNSNMIPRNVLLPVQDENRCVHFEVDDPSRFALDFDVYPTFGKKVIARGSVPAEVFSDRENSSGHYSLSLFDPRLRAVGQLKFNYQVIRPFPGSALDIAHFTTYWKATSQVESKPSSLVTGSSLLGDYLRIDVQLTADGIPVIYPRWSVDVGGIDEPVMRMTEAQFRRFGAINRPGDQASQLQHALTRGLQSAHDFLAHSFMSLVDVLETLPRELNINLHVLYPAKEEVRRLRLGAIPDVNASVDALLHVIFHHARSTRGDSGAPVGSTVFTCGHADFCTALNWKQPNYPVFFCNNLGVVDTHVSSPPNNDERASNVVRPPSTSVKEAVRIAQTNNFMGIVCRSRLLRMVPALIESIKVAGLVLISDASDEEDEEMTTARSPSSQGNAEGVDGYLHRNGILKFYEHIDIV